MKRFISLVLAALVVFAPMAEAGGGGHKVLPQDPHRWIKGITTDSTSVSLVFADVDTTAAIEVNKLMPQFQPVLTATDSSHVLVGKLTWTPAASGDSMIVTVQYSQDGTIWTSERGYIVINSGTSFPLFRWRNTAQAMDFAPYVRAILLHNDGAGSGGGTIVRTFTLRPAVVSSGTN